MPHTLENFHTPVMVNQVVESLLTDRSGIYVDATLGGGGHAEKVLSSLTREGRLIGIDRDPEAIQAARRRLNRFGGRITLFQTEFWNLREILKRIELDQVDGILFDLGVSSYQIDFSGRGFSYRQDGPLDMRMDLKSKKTAFQVVNSFPRKDLVRIFREYGEERLASRIAKEICIQREKKPIQWTLCLKKIIESVAPREKPLKTVSRIFQAIRIEVNDEIVNLEGSLRQAIDLLRPGGRIAVISYHSLEDRIAKTVFVDCAKGCICPPDLPICVCGRDKILRIIDRISPSASEIEENPRARSARLRVAEKLEVPLRDT